MKVSPHAGKPAEASMLVHAAGLITAAYFSMQVMLSKALPIYSGGLGNVAGDQLKAVSDPGVP